MIDLKKSTQTFSASPQNTINRAESSKAMSADEMAKFLGEGESVGDYLNKVANPNYTRPSRLKGEGNNELKKDDFLKLMLAQMKNQDPTNPQKSHEMAAQMAQFTSVEQLTNINKGIESLGSKGGAGGGGGYDALNFIGKVASGDSAKIHRGDGDPNHEFSFGLSDNAMDVKIEVKDAAGNLVKTLDVKDLKKGKNTVNWHGMTEDGMQARSGEYYFTVHAKNSSGKKIQAQTKFEGYISGVKFLPSGPIMMIGNRSVQMTDIKQIVDPKFLPTAKGQKTVGNNAPDLKKDAMSQQNGMVRKQAALGNIDSVPMERGLINKLDKLTK